VPHQELVPVVDALREGRLKEVIALCDELIGRDDGLFRSRAEAGWIKSEAHRYRADASYRLTGDMIATIRMLKPAADAGNFQAVQIIQRHMWSKLESSPGYAADDANPVELAKYLRIGAELGDPLSAVAIGARNMPASASIEDREKTYWSLVGFALAMSETTEYRKRMINGVLSRVGAAEADAAVAAFSPVPLGAAAAPGLPNRGLIATLYTDANLRQEYGRSYGRRGSGETRPGPSTLDVFKMLQVYANVVQDISVNLLVPGTRRFEDRSMMSMPRGNIAALLGPGDYVFARCGPMTHVAMVHHVDRAAGQVYFVDGLFQFWQPTHNSCVTRFDLEPFRHGGFLAAVPLADLEPMLEAVTTIRDRITP